MSPRKRNAERDDDASAASQRPLTPEIVDADEDTIDAFGEDAAETLDDDPDDAEGASPDSGVDPSRAAVLVPNDAPLLPSTETDRGGDALSRYMAQLAHHAPISREEEHALAVRWKEDGDVDAARQLVMHNLRLVVKIAFEYRRAWTQTLDLIQEGNVGLMEAVQRYDPYKGVKLSTYAVYWIRAYILKYILDNMRSVRLGTTRAQRKLFFRLNKEKRELERQGYEVEPALIAERLDVSEQDVIEMEASLSRPDTYLDAPMRDEDGSASFGRLPARRGHERRGGPRRRRAGRRLPPADRRVPRAARRARAAHPRRARARRGPEDARRDGRTLRRIARARATASKHGSSTSSART